MADSYKFKIINILLASIDGKIACHSHESTRERETNGFTCKSDFLRMQRLTSQCDVVFIGANTIESEQGAFRVSSLRDDGTEPQWIVFTRSGEIPFQSPFWKQENIPKSIFFVSSFDPKEKPEFHIKETDVNGIKIDYYLGNISGLFNYLQKKGCQKAALLGGGKLNAAFWEYDLVDELYLTISPVLVGRNEAPGLVNAQHLLGKKLKIQKIITENDFIYVDYAH